MKNIVLVFAAIFVSLSAMAQDVEIGRNGDVNMVQFKTSTGTLENYPRQDIRHSKINNGRVIFYDKQTGRPIISVRGFDLDDVTLRDTDPLFATIGATFTDYEDFDDTFGSLVLGKTKPSSEGATSFSELDGDIADGQVPVSAVTQHKGALGIRVSVKDFGATGDGVTDDTASLNTAFQYAKTNGIDIYVPKGTYLFDSETDYFGYNNGIRLSGGNGFKIIGEEGAKFTTSLTGSDTSENNYHMIILESAPNVTIQGIEFENTHGLTANYTYAISVIGGDSKNIKINKNKFSGFCNTIGFNAGSNNIVEDNYFFARNGHDDATTNAEPAVFIRVISNSAGTNRDLIVKNNIAYGYVGDDITTTDGDRSMDGFYYGYADGAIIENNYLYYFCEEAIASQGYEIYEPTAKIKQTIIRGNYIDSSLPTGTTNTQNYGILFDGSNHEVYNNTIIAGYGILSYGVNYNRTAKNNTIRDNKIYPAIGVDNWYPIYVAGYNTGESAPAENYNIINNEIIFDGVTLSNDLSVFSIADTRYLNIKSNKINLLNINKNGYDINVYSFIKNSDYINYGLESVIGDYNNILLDGTGNSHLNYEPTILKYVDLAGLLEVDNPKDNEIAVVTNLTNGGFYFYNEASRLSSELCLNTDFTSDTDWLKGNWTISGGIANISNNSGGMSTVVGETVNKTFEIIFEIKNYVSGNASVGVGGYVGSSTVSGNGLHKFTITATHIDSNTRVYIEATASSTFSIDNVSIKEIINNEDDLINGWVKLN